MSKPLNGAFSVLRIRDFRMLWIGQSISSLGDGVFTIALALTALKIGKRPIDLAFVIAARSISITTLKMPPRPSTQVPRRSAADPPRQRPRRLEQGSDESSRDDERRRRSGWDRHFRLRVSVSSSGKCSETRGPRDVASGVTE